MSDNKQTTRSHYLPKTYLKHFLNENSLVMYKKGKNFFKEGITQEQRIHFVFSEEALVNIGVDNGIYNPNIQNISSDDLEGIFQECGENVYDELIKSLELAPENSSIPDDIKRKLCLFMAAMRVRTPQFKSEINDIGEKFYKFIAKMHFGNLSVEEIKKACKNDLKKEVSLNFAKKLKDMAKNQNYKVKFPNAHFIKQALLLLDKNADIFYKMRMNVVKSKRFFVTSDNPVVYFVPKEKTNFYNSARSLMSPYTELFFPLTKNMSVTLNRKLAEEKIMTVNRDIVDIFNYNISYNSFDFIFSPIRMNFLETFIREFQPYPFELSIN